MRLSVCFFEYLQILADAKVLKSSNLPLNVDHVIWTKKFDLGTGCLIFSSLKYIHPCIMYRDNKAKKANYVSETFML